MIRSLSTRAQISVAPSKKNIHVAPASFTLRAANGSRSNTYGQVSLSLGLGLRRSFSWLFTVADVKMPILGADFLAHYQLAVDMSTHTLIDKTPRNLAIADID